jgi:xanthine/uracil permease
MTQGRRAQISALVVLIVAIGINAFTDGDKWVAAWVLGALAGVLTWVATGQIRPARKD